MANTGYWEFYDDQDGSKFATLQYVNLAGDEVEEPIEDDLEKQVFEIRRKNGASVPIKLCAR